MLSQVGHKKQLKATRVLRASRYYGFAGMKGRKGVWTFLLLWKHCQVIILENRFKKCFLINKVSQATVKFKQQKMLELIIFAFFTLTKNSLQAELKESPNCLSRWETNMKIYKSKINKPKGLIHSPVTKTVQLKKKGIFISFRKCPLKHHFFFPWKCLH